VLANASLEALGPEQRYQLRRFVEIGGGLLVLGGKSAFGNGGIRGSFLEDALPVQPADSRFDIVRCDKPVMLDPAGAALKLAVGGSVVSPLMHRVALKAGAVVLARAGRDPILVSGVYGKGRVVCLLGTPYGVAPAGKVLLTDWSELPGFMGRLLEWLAEAK
jgi:uncharacterized membrane protein